MSISSLLHVSKCLNKEVQAPSFFDMKRTAAVILGGGQGTRLFPLTVWRSKPAMCFGGHYRLIDVPISNSIHSGCQKIFVITQYLSTSLHQHIFKTYRAESFSSQIQLLTAEEKHAHKNWFLGTADAVRQNIEYIRESSADYFFILSGDQLYQMDFQKMMQFALQTNADAVIAALPISSKEAKRMGILKIDDNNSIIRFEEKPQDNALLNQMELTESQKDAYGLHPTDDRHLLGSMGIYLFKRDTLLDLLQQDKREDFGKHLIPTQVGKGQTAAYIFNGYWEDIGTIESYYHANMSLLGKDPLFSCYDENRPIFVDHSHLPGARISNAQVNDSIICDGSMIEGDEVTNCILGKRTIVHKGTIIRDSYVMGNDFFKSPHHAEGFSIGENCIIRKTIVDKHVHIGKGVQLINKNQLSTYDGDHVYIRDGIIVVSRGAAIPDGFIL